MFDFAYQLLFALNKVAWLYSSNWKHLAYFNARLIYWILPPKVGGFTLCSYLVVLHVLILRIIFLWGNLSGPGGKWGKYYLGLWLVCLQLYCFSCLYKLDIMCLFNLKAKLFSVLALNKVEFLSRIHATFFFFFFAEIFA